jgi:hypothetical protein
MSELVIRHWVFDEVSGLLDAKANRERLFAHIEASETCIEP